MKDQKRVYAVELFDRATEKHHETRILKNTDLKTLQRLFKLDKWDHLLGNALIETPEQADYLEQLLGEKIDLEKQHGTIETLAVEWEQGDRKKTVYSVIRIEKGGYWPGLYDIENPDLPVIRELLERSNDDPLREKTPVPPAAASYFEKLTGEKLNFEKYDYFFGAEVRFADA